MEFEGTKAGTLLNKIFPPEIDMKTKQVTTTVFVTSDEKEYLDKQKAQQHEKTIILDKELASLRKIDGDFTTCNILRLQPMKIDSGFSWYQVQNENQEADLIIMLQKRYGHMTYMMQIHEKNDYPSMIGYNPNQNVLVRFDYVKALFQKTGKDFEALSKRVENAYEQSINNLENTDEEYER